MQSIRSSIIGDSPSIKDLLSQVEKIAMAESTVLITGESGTGKELVARAVHENSNRAGKPFVTVNCGAIPGELLEAELFGHVRGAFTGAMTNRVGRFEAANGGTLFLDEIGEMPMSLQVKLLRVLQTKQFESVGSNEVKDSDVRIVAATNRNLEQMIAEKTFREDLFYRLNVIPIRVPALRERKSDIPVLMNHFVNAFNRITGHSVEAPTGAILTALLNYEWPGNVRELENLVERVVILKGKGAIEMADLPSRIFQDQGSDYAGAESGAISGEIEFPRMALPTQGLSLKDVVTAFENHLVDQALARTNGNKNRASELLQMNRTTLVEKLRKRGMIKAVGKKMLGLPDAEMNQ